MKKFAYIIKYIKPYTKYVIGLILILAFSSLINVIHPYLTYRVILDELLPRNDYSRIAMVAGLVILLGLVVALTHFIQGYIMSYLGARVAFDIRKSLLRHIQSLSLKFYADRNSGAILERLNKDVAGIQTLLTNQAVTLISNAIQIAFLTVAIFVVNGTLALLVVGMVAAQTLFIIHAVRQLHGRIRGLRKSETDLIGELQERISLIQLIQAFVKQKFEERMHHRKSMNIIRQSMDIAGIRSQMFAIFLLTTNLIPLLVIWLGVILIVQGKFQVGGLLTMVSYANNYLRPVMGIVMGLNTLQESVVGIERVKEFFDETPDITEIENPIRNVPVHGRIEFQNVDFSYEKDKQVLFENSFTIEAGQTVAFVGESGSGKSTVTNLIFRFYDPESGDVLMDGESLKKYSVRFLREQIGVVFQDTDLFAATLRENLAYGVKRRINDEEIMEAVRMTLLEDVVGRLPGGLDTEVEERGSNFSGGEKQRIAICRVLLKQPKLVIFDEATSALDSASEEQIQRTIDRVMEEPTSILIAHRLSTVIDANKIFVMKEGRIVEEGAHRELLLRGGEYKGLWDEQLKKERRIDARG